MKRIAAIMSGKVQNVGYRARVVGIAKESGITGTVQNLMDGRVKIIADGEESDLKGFLDAISIKNALINVVDVEIEHPDATQEYNDFYKLVGEGETDERLDKASEYLKELIVVVKGGFGELKEEISGVREEMRTGFGDMKEEMGGMREEMRTGFETLSSKQDQTIDEIKLMRGDLQSYRDGEVEQINVLRAHGMIDVSN
jgi:acylphosphatase